MINITKILTGVALSVGLITAVYAETTIYFGHAGPARGTIPAALKWFDGRIRELSDGDLKMDIQWGGALFKAPAAVQSIGDGIADAGSVISAYFPKEMAAYSLTDLPLSGSNEWVGLRATDKLMREVPEITENLAKQNLVYIGTFTASSVNVACKGGQIKTVADIQGKKVRGSGVYGKVFGELGATMVNLDIYKAYQALDTGLIDCTQGYAYVVPAFKWHEVIDNFTVLNWGQIGGYGMFLNKQVYDGLKPEQQKVLMQAGTELADKFAQIVVEANKKAIDGMLKDKKVDVFELSVEDSKALYAASEPLLIRWKENAASVGLDPDKLVEVFTAAVAEYDKQFKEQGYPWTR